MTLGLIPRRLRHQYSLTLTSLEVDAGKGEQIPRPLGRGDFIRHEAKPAPQKSGFCFAYTYTPRDIAHAHTNPL